MKVNVWTYTFLKTLPLDPSHPKCPYLWPHLERTRLDADVCSRSEVEPSSRDLLFERRESLERRRALREKDEANEL
jgi:hypothetical protein